MDWALSDKCPYVWYNGVWYISLKEGKGITTAELYDIWLNIKQHDKKGSLAT